MTIKEIYQELLDELSSINNSIRKSFIDSPDNILHREKRDTIKKKIKRFTDDFPEVLV